MKKSRYYLKRFFCVVLMAAMLFSSSLSGVSLSAETESPLYVTKSIIYEIDNLNYREQGYVAARFRDTKEPIPLSYCYDGKVFATVLKKDENRPIEAFIGAPESFSDENTDWLPFWVHRLTIRNILKGSDGKIELKRTIKRSEAVSIIMRSIGLKEEGNISDFQDVTPGSWYFDEVTTAEKYGIISKDTKFYPDRTVSREEFIVMAYRAFQLVGWINALPENGMTEGIQDIKDRDQISSWAKEAYASFYYNGRNQLLTYFYEEPEEGKDGFLDYYAAEPQKELTRNNAGDFIYSLISQLPVMPSEVAVQYGFDKEMPVIDGSTSTHPFTQTVYGVLFSNYSNHENYPLKHSKSHESYQRLIRGEVDMIFASVYPASDILAMAEEYDVELELIPIAYDAQVFFTNYENSIKGLSKEQISKTYVDNAYNNWNELGGPDAVYVPICRNNNSGSHAQMERYFLNGKEIHEKIRRENTAMAMSDILTEVIDVHTADSKSFGLGYSIYYYYQTMNKYMLGENEDGNPYLKLLAIDGVYPTDETIADGTYPLSNNTYLVIRKDSPKDSPERKMAEFMLTELGQQCVENAGFGPLKKK